MIGYLFAGVLLVAGISAIMDGDDDDSSDLDSNGVNNRTGDDDGDILRGTSGSDFFEGEDGDDTLDGFGETDFLFGGQGNDVVRGGDGDDFIMDTEGSDTLEGGSGDDFIVATGVMDADAVADVFELSFETGVLQEFNAESTGTDESRDTDLEGDVVDGGAGDDVIMVGDGDFVRGGTGADAIVTGGWAPHNDPVIVADFEPNEDVLVYDFADGQPAPDVEIRNSGEDAEVLIDDQPAIRVLGGAGNVTLDDVILTQEAV